jgi:hypothetical protein
MKSLIQIKFLIFYSIFLWMYFLLVYDLTFLSAITTATIFAVIKSTNTILLHTCIAYTLRFIDCNDITKCTYFRHIHVYGISKINPYLKLTFSSYPCCKFKREPGSYARFRYSLYIVPVSSLI